MNGRTLLGPTVRACSVVVAAVWCGAAHAADIPKADNVDPLNSTASWAGGVVPGSGDVAVWDGTVTSANSAALGGALAWEGIRVAAPGGDVAITGADTLTLGSSGITISGSTANLAVGTPVALAAQQVWRASTGRTITAAGVVSGTYGLEIGSAGVSDSVTSTTFLTTSPQTLFTGRNLGDLTAASGQIAGAWITNPPVSANGYLLSNTGASATYWLEIDQGGYVKGAKVVLTQNGADIQAATADARYTTGATLPYDFNTGGTPAPVATFPGGDGYGVASTTLYFGTSDANGTVTLANANTYTGPTTITRGVLTAGAASIDGVGGPFGLNSAVTLVDAIFTGLNLAGFNTSIGSLAGGGSTGGGVSLGSATLTVGGNNASTTYAGVIAGSGGLVKLGTGELTLAGNNSYDGLTTVTGGTLVLGNGAGSGALGIGAVAVGAGATFTVDRGTYGQVFTNSFSGEGTLRIDGGQDPQFAGDNSGFTGPVVIDGPDAQFRTRSANAWSGQSVVTIANGGMASVFSYVNSNDIKVGSLWGDGTVRLGASGADRDLYMGGNNLDAVFSGRIINDAGGVGSVVKNGTGRQVLSGSSSYGGGTFINGGALVVDGVLAGAGAVAVASGGTLAGSGTLAGDTTIQFGATLAPGASPGTLTFSGGLTWNEGGNYNWQMLSGTGTAGGADSWDLVRVGGSLSIAATSVSPFQLNLWTLSSILPDVSGSAANFNPTVNQTWTIASAAGGITGFAADKFAIATSAANGTGGFANDLAGGTFSLAQSGNDLNLVFTASSAVITIDVSSGTQTQTQAGYPLLSGSVPVVKTGAGTLVLDQANTLTGSTTVQAGTLQLATASALAAGRLVVMAGGTSSIAPQVSAGVAGLDLASGNGLLDVTAGGLTIAAGLTATELVTEILEGRGDGSWNGTSGITSSSAAAAIASSVPRAVGWIDNGDGSLTVAYAAPGDTNIDWSIDILDASNFLALGKFDTGSPATWIEGDFSYDGIVDILDAADFFATGLYDAGNYNAASGIGGGVAAVPEPSSLALAAVGAAAAVAAARRRGR